MNAEDYLKKSQEVKASDIHISLGLPVIFRINGKLQPIGQKALNREECMNLIKQILTDREFKTLGEKGEIDTSYTTSNGNRFRTNAFKQKGAYGAVLRVINDKIPTLGELNLPAVLSELCKRQRGIILVTGPTGSGKSTTLAAMINYINFNFNKHVLTIEDPIEYLHKHGSSVINQRQIGKDSISFSSALRASLRQDPDVILVGEMRDLDTVSVALTAAETGHLVMSTLHTIGAAKTIDRIVDIFPPNQQHQVTAQLSSTLVAVISQQIVPKKDGTGRVAALEIMITNSAIKNLIRENKTHQIQSIIQTSSKEHMRTMDGSLIELYKNDVIEKDYLLKYGVDLDYIKKELNIKDNDKE